MANLQKIIFDLNQSGLNDEAIARALSDDGCSTTQATINRLKNGVHKSARFELGFALLSLHRKHCKRSAA